MFQFGVVIWLSILLLVIAQYSQVTRDSCDFDFSVYRGLRRHPTVFGP